MSKLYWSQVRDNAIIPTKENEDGGFDLYAFHDEDEFYNDIEIKPSEIVLIPTGIASSFSSDYVGIFKERGSTGVAGLAVRAGVMDSGFRNEWQVVLQNTTDKTIIITYDVDKKFDLNGILFYPRSKAIAQVCFIKLADFEEIEIIPYEDLKNMESIRGMGMLGDSGK